MLKGFAKRCITVSLLVLFIFPFFCTKTYASLEFGANTLGLFLDSFMIKSDFKLPQGFRHTKASVNGKKNGTETTVHYIGYVNGDLTVTVDKKTNKIIEVRMFQPLRLNRPGEPVTPNKMNRVFDAWLPAVTSRYGDPTELTIKRPFGTKNANFMEVNKYKYSFTAFSGEPAASDGISLIIEAL